ncbi:hypothetical protein DPMN_164686 [Dreissena polymorpha]|uniref:Uncharacterized protein n=1 Tax=Dreissena polymorpha TaxID=45954 RepID=A0A9D4ETE2_DREPO|nr:hypothetical protein DPMN_164686 [Dreissena polymorpha]
MGDLATTNLVSQVLYFSLHSQFCMELNGLAVKLQKECDPDTCTQMTATEQWIFLCAAHKTPKEVCQMFGFIFSSVVYKLVLKVSNFVHHIAIGCVWYLQLVSGLCGSG